MSKKLIVGITGGLGTGKSTVTGIFRKLGAAVISADRIAHDLILPEGPAYKKVVSLFGVKILKKDKRIDRKKLAQIVFNDKRKLMLLNSVIHPKVIKRIKEIIKKDRTSKKVYIIDAPLLIEAGALNMIDRLIVVATDRNTQIKRCIKNFGLKRSDILKRIRCQMPLAKKRRLADFIIDNNRPLNSTKKMVEKIWEEIKNGTGSSKD